MMKQHHPDVEGGDGEMAKKLNEAYEKICEARGIH
jgi:curved DNA-binding protein CbpA